MRTNENDTTEQTTETRIQLSDGGEIILEEIRKPLEPYIGEDWSDSPSGGPDISEHGSENF